jgi:hypothetical protein
MIDLELTTPPDEISRLETELSVVHEKLRRATIERDRALDALHVMHSKVLAVRQLLT